MKRRQRGVIATNAAVLAAVAVVPMVTCANHKCDDAPVWMLWLAIGLCAAAIVAVIAIIIWYYREG